MYLPVTINFPCADAFWKASEFKNFLVSTTVPRLASILKEVKILNPSNQ